MNWSDAKWTTTTYFNEVASALRAGSFVDPEDGRPPVMQFGVNITERVDLVLKDPDFFGADVVKSGLKALATFSELHPQEFLHHIRCSIGIFDYAGLFDRSQSAARRFWAGHFRRTSPADNSWAAALRDALTDSELKSKLKDYVMLVQRGHSRSDVFREIDARYRRLGWLRVRPASYYLRRMIEPDLAPEVVRQFGE